MEERNRNRDEELLQNIREGNENTASRNQGNNTEEGQRQADEMVKGDKGSSGQGNYGSRQGDGGNRGRRGNVGLG